MKVPNLDKSGNLIAWKRRASTNNKFIGQEILYFQFPSFLFKYIEVECCPFYFVDKCHSKLEGWFEYYLYFIFCFSSACGEDLHYCDGKE